MISVDIERNMETIVEIKNSLSGLGCDSKGKLLIVSMLDKRLFRHDSEDLTKITDSSNLASSHCNDMVVDKLGNACIGNIGFEFMRNAKFKPAEIILVNQNGQACVIAEKMAFPNGNVITQDDNTLIIGETMGAYLKAFNIEQDGTLSNRRIWACLSKVTFPDDICLYSEGAIWLTSPTISEVLRIIEGGEISDRIKIQDGNSAYAWMLGGQNRRIIFICTSDNSRTNSRIEIIKVDLPGASLS